MYNPVSILKTDEGAGCPRPKNPTIILVPVEFVAAEPTREIGDIVMKSDLELIAEKRHIFKGVSPNVDFYSGFVYEMLGIPSELYTPLFAIARIAGWSAHRLEELVGCNKIIRPAYKSVMEELE